MSRTTYASASVRTCSGFLSRRTGFAAAADASTATPRTASRRSLDDRLPAGGRPSAERARDVRRPIAQSAARGPRPRRRERRRQDGRTRAPSPLLEPAAALAAPGTGRVPGAFPVLELEGAATLLAQGQDQLEVVVVVEDRKPSSHPSGGGRACTGYARARLRRCSRRSHARARSSPCRGRPPAGHMPSSPSRLRARGRRDRLRRPLTPLGRGSVRAPR